MKKKSESAKNNTFTYKIEPKTSSYVLPNDFSTFPNTLLLKLKQKFDNCFNNNANSLNLNVNSGINYLLVGVEYAISNEINRKYPKSTVKIKVNYEKQFNGIDATTKKRYDQENVTAKIISEFQIFKVVNKDIISSINLSAGAVTSRQFPSSCSDTIPNLKNSNYRTANIEAVYKCIMDYDKFDNCPRNGYNFNCKMDLKNSFSGDYINSSKYPSVSI
jgi:hypothetical protein